VLQRISTALEQLVSPVSARTLSVHPAHKSHDFTQESFPHLTRKTSQKEKDPDPQGEEQKENVIPFPKLDLKSCNTAPPTAAPEPIQGSTALSPPSPVSQAVGQTLLEIMTLFQQQRTTLWRWLGARGYSKSSDLQKKGSRLRTGSMLDRKAE